MRTGSIRADFVKRILSRCVFSIAQTAGLYDISYDMIYNINMD